MADNSVRLLIKGEVIKPIIWERSQSMKKINKKCGTEGEGKYS